MKSRSWLAVAVLLLAALVAIGCQQQQEDDTPTPPIVPGATDAPAGGDAGYPAPEVVETAPAQVVEPTAEAPTEAQPEATPETATTGTEAVPALPTETVAVPALSAQPLPPATVVEPPPAGGGYTPGSTVQHTVIRGDWLLQIARCYGTTYAAVRNANYLPYPDFIMPGTVLTVPNVGSAGAVIGPPCVQEYTVQPGDTWESLAQRYDTTAAILQRANPGALTAGRVIYVPTTAPAAGTLPSLTHHLIFILNGDMAVWRNTDSLVEVTPDTPQLLDLATNQTGRYVLARQTRDSGVSEEVVLIDTVARTSVVVETGLPPQPENQSFSPSETLHISPDGTWAVYVVYAVDRSAFTLTSFQTANPSGRYSIASPAFGPADAALGVGIFDGVSNTTFIVSHRMGIGELPYSLDRSERTIVAISGDPPQPVYFFPEVTPLPGGNYLLAQGGFIEGGAFFAIDAQTGAYDLIPGSEGYVISGATFATGSDRVDVVAPTQTGALGPQWTSYQLQVAGGAMSLSEVSSTVAETLDQAAPAGPMPGYGISAPRIQLAAPRVIAIGGSPEEMGLWQTQQGASELAKVNSLPDSSFASSWVPDGSGLLASTFDTSALGGRDVYVAASGAPLFGLSDWLGARVLDPHWVQQ